MLLNIFSTNIFEFLAGKSKSAGASAAATK